MLGIHDLPLFIAAGLLLNLTPGQDTLYIVSRSAAGGRRAGCAAALGIGAGCLLHMLAAVLGVSALLASSAWLFNLMKLAGAAYLAWIAIDMMRGAHRQWRTDRRRGPGSAEAASPPPADRGIGPTAPWPVFRQGCLTNLLNPKVALFFLAFLPQFIDRSAPQATLGLAVLGLIFCLNGTLWCLFLAWSAATIARRIGTASRWRSPLQAGAGLLMLALAARLALSKPT